MCVFICCIMTIIPNFTIFLIFSIFKFNFFFFFCTCNNFLAFSFDFYCSFINNFMFFFLKLINFIVCSLKNLRIYFMQSLPLYTSYLFDMFLNGDIAVIEKVDGIYSTTFVLDEFAELFCPPSIFWIKHLRSA